MTLQELENLNRDEKFLGTSRALLVCDEDAVIRAVNPAFTEMTGRTPDQLLSAEVTSAFPANPGDPDSDGHLAFLRSCEQVLRQNRAHHLLLHRYDLVDQDDPATFHLRYWVPTNRPVVVDGVPRGVVNHSAPVAAPAADTLKALRLLKEAADGGFFFDTEDEDGTRAGAFQAAVDQLDALGREVAQLRDALVSRASIDQAKGLIMADRHCSPEEAFKVLVKLSNDTNVRVAEVARALVYQAQHSRSTTPVQARG